MSEQLMQWHFEAWALCTIEHEEGYPSLGHLLGMYSTKGAAEEAMCYREGLAIEAHEERKRIWYNRNVEYAPDTYALVPTSQMQFSDLAHAQDMIEKAAVLINKGCGVTA